MEPSNSMFIQNIEALRARNPALAGKIIKAAVDDSYTVAVSRNGLCVLKVNNITQHSMYDPDDEGARFVQKHSASGSGHTILIYGFGFAYHVRHACRQLGEVHVFEPDMAVLRCACEQIDLKDLLDTVRIFSNPHEVLAAGIDYVLWPHQPSVKRSPQAYEQLKHSLMNDRAAARGDSGTCRKHLKILVVTPVYGGSLPIARSCHRALQALGHDVRLFDASVFNTPFQQALAMRIDQKSLSILQNLFMGLMSEMVVATCAEWSPDLVFALSQAPISIDALQRMRRNSITTAFWFVEDYTYMNYWKHYAQHYDMYFIIQHDVFPQLLQKANASAVEYLPLAADTDIHTPLQLTDGEILEYGSDISFMGAGYPNRQKLFLGLLDFNFKIWGNGWNIHSPLWRHVQREGSRIDTCDTAKIFNASRVNINLHSSTVHDGVNPAGDFVNPRTFEIAACGAFQLVDERTSLSRHFLPGSEVISFRSLDELRDKIEYYLNRPEERKGIAERSRQRVLHEHTYVQRMSSMLECIRDKVPACFKRKQGAAPVIPDIAQFSARYPETKAVFQSLHVDTGSIDIEEFTSLLQLRQEPLGKAEAMFRLMHEYHKIAQERIA